MVGRSSHSRYRVLAAALLLLLAIVLLSPVGLTACGGAESTGSSATSNAAASTTGAPTTAPPVTEAAVPGKITAKVASIQGQNGKTLSVGVYDFDWKPGAPNTFAGLAYAPITSDDFSASVVVDTVGADGQPTTEPALFQPGDYSVVFFVVAQGQAPEKFTEVRATVAGDIEVSAPAWGSW